MRHPFHSVAIAVALVVGLVVPALALGISAAADGCYTWTRTLREGNSGGDVTQLQIRVAGWSADREYLVVDGSFGPKTTAAVKRFQSAYGLAVDGVAGSQTYNKIYELQDDDCTTIHFNWSEFWSPDCNCFRGGKVSEAQVKENVKRLIWKLEAMRKKLGGSPIHVHSGFRSIAYNSSINGASNSQHMYGTAMDGHAHAYTLCGNISKARTSGFSGIIGPPTYSSHIHVDSRAENNDDGIPNGYYWDFSC